jgi:DNA-binding NtrC family response regulator
MSAPFLETTAPPAAQTTNARAQVPMLCLVIVWCEKEPWRVGECAFFPPSKVRWIGRGGEPIEEYASFATRRPGSPFPPQLGLAGCLRGDSLSRCQAKLVASAVDIEVENRRECVMVVNKEVRKTATLRPGDTLMFVGEVLFKCVLWEPEFPALEHASVAHPFGEPDAYEMVGEGPSAWRLRDVATQIARGHDFVLIIGETGTGKTGVADLIHRASSRAKGPFVVRNSITFVGSILTSELFGKLPNYPTPGPGTEGALPPADGGTLFLDEIGRLSQEAQGQLLIALEKGIYNRIGESKARVLDVRFVGATNLARSVLQPDFDYRFAAAIEIVPLRERPEDIPLIARDLLRRRLAKDKRLQRFFVTGMDGRQHPRMSGRLMEFLMHHDLPGNTRELDALLAAAVAGSPLNRIEMLPSFEAPRSVAPPSTLPRSIGQASSAPASSGPVSSAPASSGRVSSAPSSEAPSTARDAEDGAPAVTKAAVLAALASTKRNVSQAAKRLGVQRSKLHRIMKEMGIKKDGEKDEEE